MMTRARVIKAFVQADPDPSKPHHRYGEGTHDMPGWIATKALDRGDAEAVTEPEPESKSGKDGKGK